MMGANEESKSQNKIISRSTDHIMWYISFEVEPSRIILSAISLPRGQFWAIIRETVSVT